MLSQKKHRTGTSHWLSGLRILALPRFCSWSIHFLYEVADSTLLERRVKTLWGKASLPPSETSSFFLEREMPALYPMFHNKIPESSKWTRSCCWLQLTVWVCHMEAMHSTSWAVLPEWLWEQGGIRAWGPSHVHLSHPWLTLGSGEEPWIQRKEIPICKKLSVSQGMWK